MNDIYKLKLTVLQQEILRYLFVNSGKPSNARRIAAALEVSQTGVSKALSGMQKRGLVLMEKDRESGRWNIVQNIESAKVVGIKRAENLRMIYESGLAEFLENELPGAAIMLFGSYSRGEDVAESDIDMAVIGRKEKSVDLSGFEKFFRKEINLQFYPSFSSIHKSLKENILGGILIAGGVEL